MPNFSKWPLYVSDMMKTYSDYIVDYKARVYFFHFSLAARGGGDIMFCFGYLTWENKYIILRKRGVEKNRFFGKIFTPV